jgi:hypothetical protein
MVEDLSQKVGPITVPDFLFMIIEDEFPDEVWLEEILESLLISKEARSFIERLLEHRKLLKHYACVVEERFKKDSNYFSGKFVFILNEDGFPGVVWLKSLMYSSLISEDTRIFVDRLLEYIKPTSISYCSRS